MGLALTPPMVTESVDGSPLLMDHSEVAGEHEQPYGPSHEGTRAEQDGRDHDGTSEASVHGAWVIKGETYSLPAWVISSRDLACGFVTGTPVRHADNHTTIRARISMRLGVAVPVQRSGVQTP